MKGDFKFDWVEYAVVATMLLFSTLIGAYYTFFKKQDTYDEYMLGGKSMAVVPVAVSIIASFISGVALLGFPAEIYMYGTQYMSNNFATITVVLITGIFFLPVYYKLQLSGIFEYLELRFNSNVRVIGTLLYSMSLLLFLPVVIYVPALAFNQVTDLSIHVITPIISVICLFYTAFGGLKAVIWTDTLQHGFAFVAVLIVLVLSCHRLGGVREIWRINEESSRLELFNMDLDPFARNTFTNVFVGCVFYYTTNIAVNPGSVQRFLSVSSLTKARWVIACSAVGFYAVKNLCYAMGLVLYARYHQCDPVASGQIKNYGQMMPLYVMEIGKDYPGLAGLFFSGVLSAALSTMSAWLNTVGGTLYKDVMEVFFPHIKHSESKQNNIIKVVVVVLGVVCVSLVAVVERLGTLSQMSASLVGIGYGSILSLFTLGMFFPRANIKGAISGAVASLLMSGWIVVNAQYYIMQGKLRFPGKITSIDQCPSTVLEHFNSSTALLFTYKGVGTPVVADPSVALIYKLSYNYFVMFGSICGIVVGLAVSLFTEPPDISSLNPDLFSTYVHRFLPAKAMQSRPNKDEYVLSNQQECTEQEGI